MVETKIMTRERPGGLIRRRRTKGKTATYTVHIQLRMTQDQADFYERIGGTDWMRELMDELPKVAERWGVDVADLAPRAELSENPQPELEGCLHIGIPASWPEFVGAASLLMAEGTDIVKPEEGVETFDLMKVVAPNRRQAVTFRVDDDAMIDEGVRRGDIVTATRGPVSNDSLCLAVVDGKVVVRKYYRRGLSAELRVANASGEYSSVRVNLSSTEVIGPVTSLVRPIGQEK